MNNDLIKRKNAHMESILKNPKLARTLNDAIKAPIGSTKREQAKSVLSIMKKLSGIKNDGVGGPDMGMPQNSSTPSTPNYDNLMIFPAAPKFKIRNNQTSQPTQKNDGKGGPGDGTSTPSWLGNMNWTPSVQPSSDLISSTGNGKGPSDNNYSSLSSNIFDSPLGQVNNIDPSWLSGINWNPNPESSSSSLVSGSVNNSNNNTGTSNIFSAISGLNQKNNQSVLNTSDMWKVGTSTPGSSSDTSNTSNNTSGNTSNNTNVTGGTSSLPTDLGTSGNYSVDDIKKVQDALVQAGYMSQAEVDTGYGIYGPKTKAAILAAQSGAAPTGSAPVGNTGGGNTGGGNTGGGSASAAVSAAVKSGVGATGFAMDYANAKFGGGLDQYVANLDAKLKTDFNLAPLEQQLSDIKAMKGNFIPTLQTYMAGKDQYSKFIDSMISDQQNKIVNLDMADPEVAADYKRQIDYLYTLQGRQNARYTTFLNSAIADYNSDVTNVQNHYDTVYKEYQSAMTTQGTIAQNDYNNLITRMSAAYTELDNAPTKLQNLRALTLANDATALENAKNAPNGNKTNPKYFADLATFKKELTDTNATGENQNDLNTSALGANGLVGFFNKVSYAGSDPNAAADAINQTMASSLKNNNSTSQVDTLKKLIDQLSTSDIGTQAAPMILPTFNSNVTPIIGSYITNNQSDIKKAVNELVNGTYGFLGRKTGNPGLKDQATWLKNNSKLDKNVLNGIFNFTKANFVPGSAYEKDPSRFITDFFAGSPTSIASSIVNSW